MNKVTKQIQQEELYIAFLKRSLDSKNFKTNVSKEDYELTQKKYDKAKFKLKMLRESVKC